MKTKVLAAALLALSTEARAADQGAVTNAPVSAPGIPANILDGAEPGTLTAAGITAYGVFDVDYALQTHGVRPATSYYNGLQYQIGKNAQGSQSGFVNGALQTSIVGVRGDQSLAGLTGLPGLSGVSLVFDLQIGFNPLFGELTDNLKTLRQNNGVALASQTTNGDGGRAGQVFSGDAYVGLKDHVLGELRFGRNQTLLFDDVQLYDPNKLSYAFSLLSSGTYGGGYGATEDSRWNNSFKYKNTIGIVRVGAQYRFAGSGEGGQGYSFASGVDLPGSLKGLSVDSVWGHQDTAIAATSLTSSTAPTPALGSCQSLGVSLGACTSLNVLNATVSDNTAWAIMARYNFAKLGLHNTTLYGGYEHIDLANPSARLDTLNTINGYQLNPTGVNYNAFTTDRQLEVTWIAALYNITPKLSFTAAWYHLQQNSFRTTALGAAKPTQCTKPGQGVLSQSNCAGEFDWVSGLLDYQWTKRLDLYVGVSYTQVEDGLASDFTHTSTANAVFGARYKF